MMKDYILNLRRIIKRVLCYKNLCNYYEIFKKNLKNYELYIKIVLIETKIKKVFNNKI